MDSENYNLIDIIFTFLEFPPYFEADNSLFELFFHWKSVQYS